MLNLHAGRVKNMMIEEAGHRGRLLGGKRWWDDQIVSLSAEERDEKVEDLEVTQCRILTKC